MGKATRAERYAADFGKAAGDYASHRARFPTALYDRLARLGIEISGKRILDLATGTGDLARAFAVRGGETIALDRSSAMLAEAEKLAAEDQAAITFVKAAAEDTGLPGQSIDMVTAGQCWHWFDNERAFAEVKRILKPGGRLIFCHFDWLPRPGTVAHLSERIILKHSPSWPYSGLDGFHYGNALRAADAGFRHIETFSFEHDQPYSHDAWRGRIRASAGIGGTLGPDAVAAFDREHSECLKAQFPKDLLSILHRVHGIVATWPGQP